MNGQLGAVLHKGEQGNFGPDINVVLPTGVLRNPLDGEGEYVLVHLQRGGQHPEEGDEHQRGYEDQDGVDGHPADGVAPLLRTGFHISPSPQSLLDELRNWNSVMASTKANSTMATALA